MMHNKKVVIIGSAIVALAVVIVLLAVLMPRVLEKDDMRDLLREAVAPGAQYVYVTDPQYQNDDPIAPKGREAKLTGEALAAVQGALVDLSEHFSFEKSDQALAGMDLHLTVRTQDGKTLKIYFAKTHFYWCEYSTYHYFTPCDEVAYAALLQQLRDAVKG